VVNEADFASQRASATDVFKAGSIILRHRVLWD
jgi:hypothetical protein